MMTREEIKLTALNIVGKPLGDGALAASDWLSEEAADDLCLAIEDAITAALSPSEQAEVPVQWANEIIVADMLDKLIDEMFTDEAAAAEAKIRKLLWDNKIGFIRLAQSIRAMQLQDGTSLTPCHPKGET